MVFMQTCFSIEKNITATLSSTKVDKLELGSTYRFVLTLYPYELEEISKESFEKNDIIEFLYVTDIEKIKRSENNYDAITINLSGIITGEYSVDKRYTIKLGDKLLPLKLRIPGHGNVPEKLNDFTMLSHEEPSESLSNKMILLIVLIIILMLVLIFLFSKKNKKKTLYEDICDQLKKYNENKQLEYLYGRRKEIISVNSESKAFFDKLEAIQYRKGWADLDKTELNIEKNKVIEGLNGVR